MNYYDIIENYYDIIEDDYVEPLWYPDDSGEWIETYGEKFTVPSGSQFFWLRKTERNRKDKTYCHIKYESSLLEYWKYLDYYLTCAYRILS